MSAPAAPSRRYVASLDGLRAIAIVSVIAFHARTTFVDPSAIERAYSFVAVASWAGVDLFFVLSGFLITGILLDSRGEPRFFRNFYIRRTLRIFPLYYAVLAIVLVIGPLVLGSDDPGVRRILHEQGWLWTYTTNVEVLRNDGMLYTAGWLSLTHLWSLAIEEQFYLVWPLVVFVLPRRALAIVAAAIVVATPFVRLAMLRGGVSPAAVHEFTACRLDTLAIGSLLAVVARARPGDAAWIARALMIAGAVALAGVIAVARRLDLDAPAVQTVGLSAIAIGFGGVVLRAATGEGRAGRGLAHPVLTTIGRYSYGIYLFHALLLPLYRHVYDADAVARALHSRLAAVLLFTALVLAVSTALAALSWHAFERRFLALKERWAPTRGTAAAARSSLPTPGA